MKLSVAGKQIHISKAFRDHVEEKLYALNTKYSIDPVDVAVTISHEHHNFMCDIAVHVGREMNLRSQGGGSDAYTCFDNTVSILETRLRRHKKRLNDHNRKRDTHLKQEVAPSYILNLPEDSESHDHDHEDLAPAIVAEMDRKINTLSVSEAVFRMDLGNETPYLFRNSSHGRLNVLYRRDDGHIGWIDIRDGQ